MNPPRAVAGGRRVDCTVFTAPGSRLGRTAAVANTALILAAGGSRVLIVDWSGESPAAWDYLSRFEFGPSAETVGLGRLLDGLTEGTGAWRAHRCLPPGTEPIDLVRPAPHGDLRTPSLPWDEPRGRLIRRLREAIDASDYDHVLVDAPTGHDPDILDVIARGADRTVVLYEPTRQSVDGAFDIADDVATLAVTRMHVLPVEVEPRGEDASTRRLPPERVAERLAGFTAGDAASTPAGSPVRIPFVPRYADRRVLAVLAEEAGSALVRAYAALAEALTGGRIADPPALSAHLRDNYRTALGPSAVQEPDEPRPAPFTIVHTWPHRALADWVREQLRSIGEDAVLAGPGEETGGRTVWIAAPEEAASPDPPSGRAQDEDRFLLLLPPGADPARVPDGVRPLVLRRGGDEGEVRLQLFSRLGLVQGVPAPAPEGRGPAPAFPLGGRRGQITNFAAPVRVPFRGRERELGELRDRLLAQAADGCEPQVLGGPPGIGKTGMALEYLRMFGGDYGIVWWISARTTDLVRLGLSELADTLAGEEPPPGGGRFQPVGDRVAAVVRHLRAKRGGWLLVYDDAPDLDALGDLVPDGGPGHVIVTCRSARPADTGSAAAPAQVVADTTSLEPIGADAGAEVLRVRVAGLAAEDARALAATLDGLPLAVQLAAAWIGEEAARDAGRSSTTDEAAQRAAEQYTGRLGPLLAEQRTVPEACLEVTLRTLGRDDGGHGGPLERIAVRLLEMCAWLAPEGVGHGLLSSRPFLAKLAEAAGEHDGEILRDDSMILDQVLRICARYGLAQIVRKRQPILRIHRTVQELLRARLSAAGQDEDRRVQVLEALAQTVPPAVSGSIRRHVDLLTELHRHLGPSGATDRPETWVRRWVVEQARFNKTVDSPPALRGQLAELEPLFERWPDDLLKGRLLREAASIHFALGRYGSAHELGGRALAVLRDQGPAGVYWTLVQRRGLTGALCGLGRFDQALAEIQGVYTESLRLFGDAHRETVLNRVNLAEVFHLMGQYPQALRHARAAWAQRKDEFGEKDWLALRISRLIGDYLGATGDWERAYWHLEELRRTMRDLPEPDRAALMGAQRSYAIAVRNHHEVLAPPVEDARQGHAYAALRELRALLGGGHPATLAAALTYAVEKGLAGDLDDAVHRADRCRDGFATAYAADHPFVQACRVDRAALLLAGAGPVGAGPAEEALDEARQAGEALADLLGEQHPWTMVATLLRSRALTAAGRFEEARRPAEQTAEAAFDLLGRKHPYTLAAVETAQAARKERPDGAGPWPAALYLDVPFI
ncbi:FxSxx-COOH system tetratricopeptide repeat protein [Actinomadura opuntiae]|uniref:FxSxx-COOH system tetratricopeptide repeat protein n=1 Tax=Actinomadura sp. OS1-43 TaxID=604315 RepID=UPI00255B0021|nr:FxSxx-COOH system tetratricopeptide repeat protein [Actinomadura sp. OS1-43]MDL4813642.1 FxSxx-COOH system tetratricopeptide repeat protein [Actinomadura sp. OS1-43]